MENRQLAGRPELVEELTPKEVVDEKTAVQRALLYIESLHGRPATYKQKDLLRPLYDRYRILKVCLSGPLRKGFNRLTSILLISCCFIIIVIIAEDGGEIGSSSLQSGSRRPGADPRIRDAGAERDAIGRIAPTLGATHSDA